MGTPRSAYLIYVMDWMFASPQNSYTETLPLNVIILGGEAFEGD